MLFLSAIACARAVHRWPYPRDVVLALERGGVCLDSLKAARPDLASRAWRAPPAPEVEARLRFLTQMGKEPAALAEHPQYLRSQFDRHVLPRALYAFRLGVLPSLSLRQLLGTPDLDDRPGAPLLAWPAVCGREARRDEYEELFDAVQACAAESGVPLLERTGDGLDRLSAEIAAASRLPAPPAAAEPQPQPPSPPPPPPPPLPCTSRRSPPPRACAAGLKVCPLCGREIPPQLESRHHLVPRLKGGKTTDDNLVVLHRPCHDKVHAVLTEAQLARSYASVEALIAEPEIAKFAKWIAKRPVEFSDRTTSLRRREQRQRKRR